MSDPKFKPGDMVMAKNGRGDCYEVVKVEPGKAAVAFYYVLDNGAVDIRKRKKSGWHFGPQIDTYYKKVL